MQFWKGEMYAHLTRESRESGNHRNGKMQKQVQTPVGDITVTTPRDRDASFEPQFIKKRETMLSEGMADRIIGLYALGTSTRDISNWLEETVGTSVSAETISSIRLGQTRLPGVSQCPQKWTMPVPNWGIISQ